MKFIDRVKVQLVAGRGGDGIVAWRREKCLAKGGPYGGNGGRGGSITFKSDPSIHSLQAFRNRQIIRAENGRQGSSNNRQGKSGKDLICPVPCGTLVKQAEGGAVLCDLTKEGEEFCVCRGGAGGLGNSFFANATHRAPEKRTHGKAGEARAVELELKLIADVGLLGWPNAGKSTLFHTLTRTAVKTGAYPFTTLQPNLSFIEFGDFSRIYLADIPGIVEGAHKNRGLGLSFLRHVARCSSLLYLIDISGGEGRHPYGDFLALRQEIASYSLDILHKPFLVALNKIDCKNSQKHLEDFQKAYPFDANSLIAISARQNRGLASLKEKMRTFSQPKSEDIAPNSRISHIR